MYDPDTYLTLSQSEHSELFEAGQPVWVPIGTLASYLQTKLSNTADRILGEVDPRAKIGTQVYLAPGAKVEAFATIIGPAWIGSGTVVRGGAYLRENVIVGNDCTLGNSCEFKNCLLFNNCEVPHFNYVGDSILGYKAHLGAGVICSNVRLDRKNIFLNGQDTGLRKFGAIVGDRTEVGCNTTLNPGSILGRDCVIYPCTNWVGELESETIAKNCNKPKVEKRRVAN